MTLDVLFPLLNTGAIVVFLYLFFAGKVLPRSVVDELIKASVAQAVTAAADALAAALAEQQIASNRAITELAARTISAVNSMVEENRAILEQHERTSLREAYE